MSSLIVSLAAGVLFAIGLVVAQMVNPAKVIAFLDVAGEWDPTLAFVMFGALAAALPGSWLARRRTRPILAERFHLPSRSDIDAKLIVGAALFGVGWGLVGFCPGPAIAALGFGGPLVSVFVVAMLCGMVAARIVLRSRRPGPTESAGA